MFSFFLPPFDFEDYLDSFWYLLFYNNTVISISIYRYLSAYLIDSTGEIPIQRFSKSKKYKTLE